MKDEPGVLTLLALAVVASLGTFVYRVTSKRRAPDLSRELWRSIFLKGAEEKEAGRLGPP